MTPHPTRPILLAALGILSLIFGTLIYFVGGRPLLFGAMAFWGMGALLGGLSLTELFLPYALGHRIRVSLLSLALAGIVAFSALEIVVIANARDRLPKEQPSAVVILGASLWSGRPSPVLQKRLITGADWLRDHPEVPVIVTGGVDVDTGETRSEAAVMAEVLAELGIDPARILVEEQAVNTRENLLFSKEILQNEDISTQNLLIVSSAPHLARVLLLAERCGLEGAGTLASEDPGGWSYRSYLYLREAAALVKSFLFDHAE